MAILAADNCFKKGLTALAQGRPAEATAMFEAAMVIERERGVGRPQMRYLSYYGLGLAQSSRPTKEAIKACETAATRDFFNPDLFLNLGKVYLLAGKYTRAMQVFEHGLKIAPRHPALRAELERVDRRAKPPFPKLSRNHFLNRWFGMLRARFLTTTRRQDPQKRTV